MDLFEARFYAGLFYPTPSPWPGYTPLRAIPSHGSMWGFPHIAASRLEPIINEKLEIRN